MYKYNLEAGVKTNIANYKFLDLPVCLVHMHAKYLTSCVRSLLIYSIALPQIWKFITLFSSVVSFFMKDSWKNESKHCIHYCVKIF